MNYSSLFLSVMFHVGIIVSLLTFFNSELHQKIENNNDFVSLQIVENNLFKKEKQIEITSNKSLKMNRVKQDKPIQNLTKKNQNTQLPITKSQPKEKVFEIKKDIKKPKLFIPKITKNINRNNQLSKGNFLNKKISMSVIPNIENFIGVNQKQKFYTCSSSQRSKLLNNKIKKSIINKNVTITSLLGNNFYDYNPYFINISNLLKNQQGDNKKDINISELLNKRVYNHINCN